MDFSVIIPLYNKAQYIERAVNSILAQTIQDFEIIVVNDGSSDNGQAIVSKLKNARIQLINQKNQGVSKARNVGIAAAKYELVAFLDADDEWLPDYLSNIKMLINNFPDCGAYATSIQTIRPNGKLFLPNLRKLPPEPWIGILPNFFDLFQDGLSAFIPSSIVIPKKILLDVGGFPEGIVLFEDIVSWVNIAIRYPIAFTPKRLVIYHQEAINRSNIHKNLHEAPFIKQIHDAIKSGVLSRELQEEALEFVAQRQVFTAAANIIASNSVYARQLLSSCSKTKKYKREWCWWWFWANFPEGWPMKILEFKQRLIG